MKNVTNSNSNPIVLTSQHSFPMDIGEAEIAVLVVIDSEIPECDEALRLLESEQRAFPDISFFQLIASKSPFVAAQLGIRALPSIVGWRQGDVPPVLSSAAIWSPIPQSKEIGREEALFRRADHRLPA